MTRISSKIIIDVSADVTWQVISDFSAAYHYLASVVNSTVEGAGVGALRTLTGVDGSMIVERLESVDHASHQLRYSLLTETPFRDCQTRVNVHDLGRERSEVTWSATFTADGIPINEAQEMLVGALAANCLALKQFLEE